MFNCTIISSRHWFIYFYFKFYSIFLINSLLARVTVFYFYINNSYKWFVFFWSSSYLICSYFFYKLRTCSFNFNELFYDFIYLISMLVVEFMLPDFFELIFYNYPRSFIEDILLLSFILSKSGSDLLSLITEHCCLFYYFRILIPVDCLGSGEKIILRSGLLPNEVLLISFPTSSYLGFLVW